MVWVPCALAAWCVAAELPPFDKHKIGKPPALLGVPLLPDHAVAVDARGREAPARVSSEEVAREQFAGYPSVGVGPGLSLRWKLPDAAKGEFWLYFLVRTGHQRGYEYVAPEMTYTVSLDGKPVPLELVPGLAAVRVYQSKDSWGHDMGWIRSTSKLALRPGQKVTVGCREKYAFVSMALLVSDTAEKLAAAVASLAVLERRVEELQRLLQRIGEVFPAISGQCGAASRRFGAVRRGLADLKGQIEAAGDEVKRGESPDLVPIQRRAGKVEEQMRRAEAGARREVAEALGGVSEQLQQRAERVRIEVPADFAGRECEYARSVAVKYLRAAGELVSPGSVQDLRRLATYCWRAEQFLSRAERAHKKARRAWPKPETRHRVSLQSRPRIEVLLNGVWEMSTEGSPDKPPVGGWFAIRVPHGPWHESIGRFMALDRRWPAGQKWAWYRTRFVVPQQMRGSAIFVYFGAVFHLCEVYVNGHFVGRHIGGFDDFEFDITDHVRPGEQVEMLCFVHDTSYTAVEKSKREGEPRGCSSGPNHYAISDLWGARFGGIWQDVWLRARAAVWAHEVFVIPSVRRKRLTVRTVLKAREGVVSAGRPLRVIVRQHVLDGGRQVLRLPEQRAELTGNGAGVEVSCGWSEPKLWGIGGPYGDPRNLYVVRTEVILDGRRQPIDVRYDRFGFREFWIADGQFWLNGKRLPLQGGGTWYLQEGKIPHGNRWWAIRFFQTERYMNVNIERWHRHGDVTDEMFDLTDELGMLNEPEGPYWGVYGVPDILGYSDWDDPVWTENVTEHYRRWVKKHFNHPSIVLWSIENETFTRPGWPEEMLNRFLAFGDAVKQVDPTRPITYHGSANGGYADQTERLEIVNLHYPSNDKVKGWKERWGGRPCIDGEFQNYPPLFLMCHKDRQVAAENMRKLQRWIESKWRYYRDVKLSGAFYFLPYMAGLVSTARPEWMGPWGDLMPDLEKAEVVASGWRKGTAKLGASVPISWPSLSGPGIKCERLQTDLGHRSLINWFDPQRPVATLTPVADTIRRCWQSMPPLRGDTAPEVIVAVRRDGRPAAGVPVLAVPGEGQPVPIVGAVTDPAGTAWLVLKAEGRYGIVCGPASIGWNARRLPADAPPGWAHIPRAQIELG